MNKKDKPKKKIMKKGKVDWEDVAKRAMADLANYKKQQEQMRGEMTQFMSLTLMHKFLSVYDDLNRVINMDDIPANVKEGIEAIEKKFDEIFKSEGLEKLSVETGEKFDPNTMEAISYEENENIEEDHVIDQFETGLKYKERVIKPVKVRVSKGYMFVALKSDNLNRESMWEKFKEIFSSDLVEKCNPDSFLSGNSLLIGCQWSIGDKKNARDTIISNRIVYLVDGSKPIQKSKKITIEFN